MDRMAKSFSLIPLGTHTTLSTHNLNRNTPDFSDLGTSEEGELWKTGRHHIMGNCTESSAEGALCPLVPITYLNMILINVKVW